jgi:hypothetical protein
VAAVRGHHRRHGSAPSVFDDFDSSNPQRRRGLRDWRDGLTIVAINATLGAADTPVTQAWWRLKAECVIDPQRPAGTITLDVRVQGTTLFLAGQEYQRVN